MFGGHGGLQSNPKRPLSPAKSPFAAEMGPFAEDTGPSLQEKGVPFGEDRETPAEHFLRIFLKQRFNL